MEEKLHSVDLEPELSKNRLLTSLLTLYQVLLVTYEKNPLVVYTSSDQVIFLIYFISYLSCLLSRRLCDPIIFVLCCLHKQLN